MADTIQTIAQARPAAATPTDLATLSAPTLLRMLVTNTSATATTFNVWFRPGGVAAADVHKIAGDVAIGGNDVASLAGFQGVSGDIITVEAAAATVNFHLMPVQVT